MVSTAGLMGVSRFRGEVISEVVGAIARLGRCALKELIVRSESRMGLEGRGAYCCQLGDLGSGRGLGREHAEQ